MKEKIMQEFEKYSHWLLRIAIASVFVYHGIAKFPVLEPLSSMLGLSVGVMLIVAILEIIAGLLVLAGGASKDVLTQAGAAIIIPILLGAIFMYHWGRWNFVATESHPMGGMEFQVTLLLLSIYLFFKNNDKQLNEKNT